MVYPIMEYLLGHKNSIYVYYSINKPRKYYGKQKKLKIGGHGGISIYSQHSGDRGRNNRNSRSSLVTQ